MDGSLPPTGDIARRAFDVVANIQRAETLAELERSVETVFRDLGFTLWVGFDILRAESAVERFVFGHTHPQWHARYVECDYEKSDGVIRECLSTDQPFFWSDAISGNKFAPIEQQILNEASEFGLRDGFALPMHNLDGSTTAIFLTGEKVEKENPDLRAASHFISIYYGSMARRLGRRRHSTAKQTARLTERQLDCLRWVREGKSANDIGQILGISPYTVQEHINATCAKLGVRTRVQAVAEAVARGLLYI